MSATRRRIPLDPEQPGLNTAFSGLDLPGLPPGPLEAPTGGESAGPQPKPGRVVLRRETSGRGGKTVIVIHGFAPHFTASHLENLAHKLRKNCGGGGTVKERAIEIQGDQQGKIRALLVTEGFQVAGVT